MKTGQKLKNAFKLCIALINGDNSEATAIRILNEADSAIEFELAQRKYQRLKLVRTVEDAEERAKNALVNNGVRIGENREAYIEGLIQTQNDVDDAKEELELHDKTVALMTKCVKALAEEAKD